MALERDGKIIANSKGDSEGVDDMNSHLIKSDQLKTEEIFFPKNVIIQEASRGDIIKIMKSTEPHNPRPKSQHKTFLEEQSLGDDFLNQTNALEMKDKYLVKPAFVTFDQV